MDYKFLEQFGFDEKEAKIYYALIKLGSSPVTKIAYETDIDRTLCYYILDRLLEKGVVSESFVEGKKIFIPKSPEIILSKLKDSIDILENKITELKEIYKKRITQVKAEVLFGINGLKIVLDDILKEGKDYCCYGQIKLYEKYLPIKIRKYLKELEKRGIKERLLQTKEEPELIPITTGQVKYLPKNMLFPVSTYIYCDKVALTIWSDTITTILIHDEKIAEAHQKHFDYMWQRAKTK